MSLPLLTYPLSSQNQRVNSYEIPGDEHPRRYTTDDLPKGAEVDAIIWACYRQVFNEQQIIHHHRQIALESQLRCGQITVCEFIRGLVLSDSFRRLNYESNNNYRFVEMCIQRLLGRRVYDEREKLAWSVVLATKGLYGFIDELISSDEYLEHFGDTTVPYQRRRILPQQSQGELPFARMARYDSYHLNQLQQLDQWRQFGNGVIDRSAKVYRRVLFAVPTLSIAALVATIILIASPK
ncbi:MAG: phycobilisome rod-core linker polypeptide CpcG [Cyanobacteria bacterium RU_5_0]|nr:phycobilisome rod-core linker polypeptide CpcG [Cyanobacteria bacterium RU_5_0]